MMKRAVRNGNVIGVRDMKAIIKFHIRIPKRYQNSMIKELIELELLKRLGRDNYEIITITRKAPIDSLEEPLW